MKTKLRISILLILFTMPAIISSCNSVRHESIASINSTELKNAFDGGSPQVVYLGFEECPWCIEALPILEKAAQNTGVSVSSFDTRHENNIEYYETVKGKICVQFDLDYLFVPCVIAIDVNGQIDDIYMGTVDAHNAIENKMTEEQARILETTYITLLSNWREKNCKNTEKLYMLSGA